MFNASRRYYEIKRIGGLQGVTFDFGDGTSNADAGSRLKRLAGVTSTTSRRDYVAEYQESAVKFIIQTGSSLSASSSVKCIHPNDN